VASVLAPELAVVAASVVVAVVSARELAVVPALDWAAVLVQDLAAVLARELAVVLAPVAPEQELAALVSVQARAMAALVLASVSVAAAQRIDSPSKPARRCLLRQHATTLRCSPPRPARPWRSHYRFVPIEWQSTAPGLPRSKRSRKAS
jgi:hypothetical protein